MTYFEEQARKWAIRYICPISGEPITPYERGAVKEITEHLAAFGRLMFEMGAEKMKETVLESGEFHVPYIENIDPPGEERGGER
jgi:hypothetical protein